MESICSSETLVVTQRSTWRYIPEVDTLLKVPLSSRMRQASDCTDLKISFNISLVLL
jgi:hypothetical protein